MIPPLTQGAGATAGRREVRLNTELADCAVARARWDDLAASATPCSLFSSAGWLTAWRDTLGSDGELIVPQVFDGERLVAAAAFVARAGVVAFAGRGPSDYADFLLSPELDDAAAVESLNLILEAAVRATDGFRHFMLTRVPMHSRALALLPRSSFYARARRDVNAPCMDMGAAPQMLRKKSLLRHERGLHKRGVLCSQTYQRADDILPRLDAFFAQHVDRWAGTGSPSLFCKPAHRDFYRAVTRHLDATGWLRYTELRLDGSLAAAHFGFLQHGRYIWYKPSFDPALARLSPGEVLIKRLLEQALAENARLFDFTIGDEPFKHRFATDVPCVMRVYVTDSPLRYAAQRARGLVGQMARRLS